MIHLAMIHEIGVASCTGDVNSHLTQHTNRRKHTKVQTLSEHRDPLAFHPAQRPLLPFSNCTNFNSTLLLFGTCLLASSLVNVGDSEGKKHTILDYTKASREPGVKSWDHRPVNPWKGVGRLGWPQHQRTGNHKLGTMASRVHDMHGAPACKHTQLCTNIPTACPFLNLTCNQHMSNSTFVLFMHAYGA